MLNPELFVYGAAGAASLELIKLREYFGRVSRRKFESLIHSNLFWIAVGGLVIASGFLAWAMHAQSENVKIWQVVVTGMAARSVVRDLLAMQQANKSTRLGEAQDGPPKVTLRDVFLGETQPQ
jgi:hypothetical protein